MKGNKTRGGGKSLHMHGVLASNYSTIALTKTLRIPYNFFGATWFVVELWYQEYEYQNGTEAYSDPMNPNPYELHDHAIHKAYPNNSQITVTNKATFALINGRR